MAEGGFWQEALKTNTLLKARFDRTEVFYTFERKSLMQLTQRYSVPPPLVFLIGA
jgi:hypothetical protein